MEIAHFRPSVFCCCDEISELTCLVSLFPLNLLCVFQLSDIKPFTKMKKQLEKWLQSAGLKG